MGAGLILGGGIIGIISAIVTLILGHSIWLALVVYSGMGILAVIALGALVAIRGLNSNHSPMVDGYSLARQK